MKCFRIFSAAATGTRRIFSRYPSASFASKSGASARSAAGSSVRSSGTNGPNTTRPSEVALVEDRLHDVPAAGEALHHPRDRLLRERIALHRPDGGDAALAARGLRPDVAAEVGVPDAHLDELVAHLVEHLDADAVQLGEGVADVPERPEVEQVPERQPLLQERRRHRHRAGASARPRAAHVHVREDLPEELALRHVPGGLEAEAPVEAAVGELEQRVQRLEDALAADRHRGHDARLDHAQEVAELGVAPRVLEIALVHLDDDGQGPVVEPVRLQVLQHVVPVGERRRRLAAARVGDEHHRVGALEHDAPGGLVHHLARHRVELQLHLHARPRAEEHGHHVEEQRPIVLRVERHETPADLGMDLLEERLEVRRLPGQRRAVIDDLHGDLAGLGVELGHFAVGRGGCRSPGAYCTRSRRADRVSPRGGWKAARTESRCSLDAHRGRVTPGARGRRRAPTRRAPPPPTATVDSSATWRGKRGRSPS